MVSKSQKKLINSLHQKKYRKQHHMFIAEGLKVVQEFIRAGFQLHSLYTTEEESFDIEKGQFFLVSESELKQITQLKTPQKILALFFIPEKENISHNGLILALDDVRDPGNLGTIIRLCDWFGIETLICSDQTVDCFNPKVVQSTMGSLARVNVVYTDLVDYLKKHSSSHHIYGAFMDGKVVYSEKKESGNTILVMGNEANGISVPIEKLIQKRISIPRFGDLQETESLNVAMATAILLNEFRRDSFFTEK
ncbi:MAG: RNA methyltransferase [Aquimarina sp.]|nr:RNA methyltransferase [Aquimarina sp.]